MARPPRKGTIAAALGISPAAFSRYIKRGCPAYSIEAAKTWQRQFVDPAQRLAKDRAKARQDRRPNERFTIDQIIEKCLQSGEAAGMRKAFDWIYRTPEAAAAVLIRHAGLAPAEACRLAFIAGAGLHAIALKLHELEDEDLAETFHGFWKGNVEKVRAELPDEEKLEVRAVELAADLWPA